MNMLPDPAWKQLSQRSQNEDKPDDPGDGSGSVTYECTDRDGHHPEQCKIETCTQHRTQDTWISQ